MGSPVQQTIGFLPISAFVIPRLFYNDQQQNTGCGMFQVTTNLYDLGEELVCHL